MNKYYIMEFHKGRGHTHPIHSHPAGDTLTGARELAARRRKLARDNGFDLVFKVARLVERTSKRGK